MNLWPFGSKKEVIEQENISENIDKTIIQNETEEEIKRKEEETKRKEEIKVLKKKADLEVAFIKINDLERRTIEIEILNKEQCLSFEVFNRRLEKEQEGKEKQFKNTVDNFSNLMNEQHESIEKLKKDRDILIKVNKSLISFFEELLESLDDQDKNNQYEKLKERRTKDLELTNKNFSYIRKLIKKSDEKYKALVEIFSEKVVEEEKLPDLFSNNISLRKVLKMKNDNSSLLFSIAYMFKKYFDAKGMKL